MEGHLEDGIEVAIQPEPNGTGGAVAAAASHIDAGQVVVVLSGDVPLVSAAVIAELVGAHAYARAAATVATTMLDDPSGYGRVVRGADGDVTRIVETKATGDATAEELAIHEVNTGIYVFDGGALLAALPKLTPENAQGELYLPDVLAALRENGATVAAHVVDDPLIVLGINDRTQLAQAREIARRRIVTAHLLAGVDVVDPASTIIDAGVTIGQDTVVEPFTVLRGATSAGEGCRIGPGATLTNVALGDDVTVLHTYAIDCEVRSGASVGPFAYLRPGTLLREKAKIGTFVEVKNSDIGEGTKVPHLSYLGDTDVGPGIEPRRRVHHRQLRRGQQAPHHDRRRREGQRRHVVRGAGDRRRQRVDRRRERRHRGRAAGRAGRRPRAPGERRGLRRASSRRDAR